MATSSTGTIRKFSCSICHKYAALSYESVLKHIGSVHSCEPNFHITCGVEGCPRTYRSYRSFRHHLTNKHCGADLPASNNTIPSVDDDHDHEESDSMELDSLSLPLQPRPENYEVALFLLKAREERQVSQLALDGLIDDFTELYQSQVVSLSEKAKNYLSDMNCDSDVITGIDELIKKTATTSIFKGLESSYHQKNYYERNFNYVVRLIVIIVKPLPYLWGKAGADPETGSAPPPRIRSCKVSVNGPDPPAMDPAL